MEMSSYSHQQGYTGEERWQPPRARRCAFKRADSSRGQLWQMCPPRAPGIGSFIIAVVRLWSADPARWPGLSQVEMFIVSY